jgi:hypothetical protein
VFAAIVASAGGIPAARASDLPVTYAVQDKPLKTSAVAGTPLTFTLYRDAVCTQQVYQATVPVQNVTLISKLKLLTPKGATKAPTTDEIRATLPGVTAGGNLYLTVAGTGVTPSGAACQAQAANQGSLTTLARVTLANQSGGGWTVYNDPSNLLPLSYPPIFPADRQAASALQGLNLNTYYACDVDTLVQNGALYAYSDLLAGEPAIYGVTNCSVLPASCSALPTCGGPCPPCGDFQRCTAPSDCASGHCGGVAGDSCYPANPAVCIPAHCFNGVKDGGESDVDCGNACRNACAIGKMCSQICDCQNSCVTGVCQ